MTKQSSPTMPAIWSWQSALYLSKPKACSRVEGHFFLSTDTTFHLNNGMIHNTIQLIKNVMSSVANAELGMLYINRKIATQWQHTLTVMGYPQPPHENQQLQCIGSCLQYDYSKGSKAMNMHFHWLRLQKTTTLPLSLEAGKKTMPITAWSIIWWHTNGKCTRYSSQTWTPCLVPMLSKKQRTRTSSTATL